MQARFLVPLFLFFGLIVLFWFGLSLNPKEVPSPLVGKPAPSFELEQLHDADKRLTIKTLTDQPVAIFNVWASWCVACRQEHPFLMALAKQKQLPIFGLNYKDERADAIGWLKQHGNPYDLSGHDLDGRVGLDYGVYGVPETFVVDSKGVIRYKHIGPLSPDAWQRDILPVVAQIRSGS